jgi:hypothetical protein
MSWIGTCQIGFDLTWLREGTAAILEGDLGNRLPADCSRLVRIVQNDAPPPFQTYTVSVEGDEQSLALRHLLIDTPYDGTLLHNLFQAVDAALNQAIANRVRFLLSCRVEWPPAELRIPLHFPFLDRTTSKNWMAGKAHPTVTVEKTGRIISQDRDLYQSVLLLAGAARSIDSPDDFSLVFEDQQTMLPSDARYRLPSLLEAFDMDQAWLDGLTASPIEVTWSLEISGRMAIAWLGLAPERSLEFFETMSEASIGMQKALRLWAPYTLLTDPERLAQVDLLHPILAYSVMRPFRSNRLKQYVPDVLDREALARSLKSVTRRMSARLQQTQDYLRETGHAEDAKRCVPKKPARILEDMGRMPKNFASLVACESHVLDEMLRLAAVGRTLARQYTGHPPHQFKNLWREGLEFARMLELRLRRGAANGYLTKLASLVLIEATRALAQARGLDVPLMATLALRPAGTASEWVATRKIGPATPSNSANSDDLDPLE